MKRKTRGKSFKKELKIINDSGSDANLEISSAKLSSIHKPTTIGDPIDRLDDRHSLDASQLLSNPFGNIVKNSHRSSDFHRNSESADMNVKDEELSKLLDSGSSGRKIEGIFLFKHPSAASLYLSFTQQPPDSSDSTTAVRNRQEITRNMMFIPDEEDNHVFSGGKTLREHSAWTDPTRLAASAFKKHTTLKNQPHSISDIVDDNLDFRNALVDQPASITRSKEDDDRSDSSEEILNGNSGAVVVISEDNPDSSIHFQNPADSLRSQPLLYKSRITATDNNYKTMKSTIADEMTITKTSFAHRSEQEAKPTNEKVFKKETRITLHSPVTRIKKLHRAEGVVTGLSPAEGAAMRLNGYHKIRTTVSDANRSLTNGEGNELNEEHQHNQILWKSKRRRGEMTSSKSRLHSQTTFEGSDESALKVRNPLKNGISKKKNPPSITMKLGDDFASLATIASGDAYVDDNGLFVFQILYQ